MNEIENAVVLFSCELKNGKLESPMYILSTDISLNNRQIISHYLNRWWIEISFRYEKYSLGLKHHEMRNLKGISRCWQIIYLAQSYLILRKKKCKENLGETIAKEREEVRENIILKVLSRKKSLSNKKM